MEQVQKKIDELLQIRQDGILNYARATKELIEMGVKIGNSKTGQVRVPSSFHKYISKFNRSNMEFEWQVEYTDGEIVDQFYPKEHNFLDIDQSRLKRISFISNFSWPTANEEKKVILTLDWETGRFAVQNGFISQEDRGYMYHNFKDYTGEKKLVLFTRKRISSTMGEIDGMFREFTPPMDEFFHYNRFVLGYEIPGTDQKRMLMIFPTGRITVFNN